MEKIDSVRKSIFHPFVLSAILGFLAFAIIFIFVTSTHAQGESTQKKALLSSSDTIWYLTPLARSNPTPTVTSIPSPTSVPTSGAMQRPTSPGTVWHLASPTPTPSLIPTIVPSLTLTPTPTPKSTTDPTQDSVWDKLAQCESGGNWKEDTGNGYFGGIQFNQTAWESVGGSGKPSDASREDQITKGKLLQQRRGWSPWSGCSKALGLN